MMSSQGTVDWCYRSPLALSVVVIALFATHAMGQFTTVINVPPDPAPTSIGSNTQLNVLEGGVLPARFNAGEPNASSVNMEVNIFGGAVGDRFNANSGSTVNVSDGSIGERFDAFDGSIVNVSGGSIGYGFEALSGSAVNISGGSVGTTFGEYCGICVPDFSALNGSTVNISGGSVGDRFSAENGSTVNISGGSIGNDFFVNGGTVNISDGSIGDRFYVQNGGTANISGGAVRFFYVDSGSTVNISGGAVDFGFLAFSGSTVNVSGGAIGDHTFDALSGSKLNLFGTQYLLDGMDITASLAPNVPFTVRDRGVILNGLLADGSAFWFVTDNVQSGATLTVTLVPEPNTIVLVLVLCGICAFGRSAGRRVGIGY